MKNDKMKNQYRVNEQIRARDVRVVSDGGAEVMPARKAIFAFFIVTQNFAKMLTIGLNFVAVKLRYWHHFTH